MSAAAVHDLVTLRDWLRYAVTRFGEANLAFGHGTTNAYDEAAYLLLHGLHLPLDRLEPFLDARLTQVERLQLAQLFDRRIELRVPAAYLTHEAWLGGLRFYVDERVIIPRSYFVEIIPQQLDGWLPDPEKVRRVADVCTGSGCLAILLAHHFPAAKVDALDLSAEALKVAAVNVRAHRLVRRVTLHRSDVFDSVSAAKYDVILSNPPYEPSAHVAAQSPEFKAEPRVAHDGGKDGLVIIRRLLRQARTRLTPQGIVLIEVGGLRAAMDREFAALEPHWLPTADGADCVCVIHAARLRAWRG